MWMFNSYLGSRRYVGLISRYTGFRGLCFKLRLGGHTLVSLSDLSPVPSVDLSILCLKNVGSWRIFVFFQYQCFLPPSIVVELHPHSLILEQWF